MHIHMPIHIHIQIHIQKHKELAELSCVISNNLTIRITDNIYKQIKKINACYFTESII